MQKSAQMHVMCIGFNYYYNITVIAECFVHLYPHQNLTWDCCLHRCIIIMNCNNSFISCIIIDHLTLHQQQKGCHQPHHR